MTPERGVGRHLTVVLVPPAVRRRVVRDAAARGHTVVRPDDIHRRTRSRRSSLLVLDEPFARMDDAAAAQFLAALAERTGPVACVTSTTRILLWARPLDPDRVTIRTNAPSSWLPVPLPRRVRPPSRLDVVTTVAAALAFVIWGMTVGRTDVRAMNDVGLIGVLPVPALAAMGLLSVSFALALRRPRPTVLLSHLVLLVAMLYGVATVVADVPRLNVSWRHAGIADQLMRTGVVDRSIDAYFNWPGFFILLGTLTDLAGFATPMAFASWASVYFNLFFLLPLWAITGHFTADVRLRWLSLWVFLLGNWVNQDYLAPQALAMAALLVIVALVLGWLGPDGGVRVAAPARVGALLLVVAAFVLLVPSHQITPLAAVGAVTALVAARRCEARTLPVVLAVLAVAWISLMTEPFLAGRIHDLVESVGDVSRSANANVGERLRGSPEHVFVVRLRLAATGGLWLVAAAGAIRRRRHGRWDAALVGLAAAPFPLLAFQPYGGEMLLRVYLFGLAFVSILAAAFVLPSPRHGRSWMTTAGLAVGLVLMTGGFLVARYGNERINQFTHAEVAAVERLYELAPRGSLIVAGSGNLPWRSQHYADMDYSTLLRVEQDRGRAEPRLEDLLSVVQQRRDGCAFVIISRAEMAYVDLLGVWPPGSLQRLRDEVRASPFMEVAYANEDAVVFRPSRRLTGIGTGALQSRDGGDGAGLGCRG